MIALVLLVAYVVTVWAMAGKPAFTAIWLGAVYGG